MQPTPEKQNPEYLLTPKTDQPSSPLWKVIGLPTPPVNPKYRYEIAAEYGVSREHFRLNLKRRDIILSKGYIYPSDRLRIYAALGCPENYQP